MRAGARWIVTALGVLGAQACSGGLAPGTAATRDSAGIRIVENSGPAWPSGKGWKVVDSPLVDIGGKGGEPVYELDQVKGPVRLADGRLAIASSTTNDVRIYDASGKHLVSSGRGGSGPGEYQSIQGIWVGPGDSLLVADLLLRRLSVLDGSGKVVRSFSLGGQMGQITPTNGKVDLAIPTGWFADGSVAGLSQSFAINQSRPGVYRDTVTILHYNSDGAVRDTLGRFPGTEMETTTYTIQGQNISAPSAVPLGKQTTILVTADRLVVVQNNAWEIEVRGLDGKLRTLIRTPAKAVRITPSDMAGNRKEQLAAMEAQAMFRNIPEPLKAQVKARVDQAKYPPTFPFFSFLLGDQEGNVWALEANAPARIGQRYDVVDSTGRFLGVVSMPKEFRPSFITADAIFGVWKDADEVEHVRGYPLRKP